MTAAIHGRRQMITKTYGWLFLYAGVVFVAAPRLVIDVISSALAWLPASRPLSGQEPTLWLALAGSMMAMISYLSFELSRDPNNMPAWNVMIISKTVSATLFLCFALLERNSLWLVLVLIDGPIGIHFALMRPPKKLKGDDLVWAAQSKTDKKRFYEIWFLKLNDPMTRNALWVRYTILKKNREIQGTCWYILFDSADQIIRQGRWDAPAHFIEGGVIKIGESRLSHDRAAANNGCVSWNLGWQQTLPPRLPLIPKILRLCGIAKSNYVTPMPCGIFNGEASIDGALYRFNQAPGSAGHIWGRRMPHHWRWAQAILGPPQNRVVIEILSARARLGPFLLPPLTFAHCWLNGRYYSCSLKSALMRNKINAEKLNWSYELVFSAFKAKGFCRPGALVAEVAYEDTDGRKLLCHNTKTGFISLDIMPGPGMAAAHFETQDQAAIETVAPAP
ncbi:MAG: hypothetical protein HY547_00990 [Elusimicrobia bacterium]|nr:hypothetical protein [Elusimicrobiota bacterium]